MTNFEYYKEKILVACANGTLSMFFWNEAGINIHAIRSENNIIRWLYKDREILDKQEKEYLSAVI